MKTLKDIFDTDQGRYNEAIFIGIAISMFIYWPARLIAVIIYS